MYIRKLVSITAAALALAGSVFAEAPVSLFDGKTLNGWVQVPANSWTVTNGVMASKGLARGEIYTSGVYSHYRIIFSHRHNIAPTGNHYGSALIFCDTPPPNTDALHGIQFGLPNGAHWDYRAGHNNGGGSLFHVVSKPGFAYTTWSRVEILVDATKGTARMAVAQPVGTKAVEVLDFSDPTAGKAGPVAFQMHNAGLFDEYKDITIEVNPTINDLITTGTVIPPSTVENPTFSPGAGTYTSAQQVTLSTATSGATIHYTTNGTTPSATVGTVYSGPITVASSTTLKAIATKSGANDSSVSSAAYIINISNGGTVFQGEDGVVAGGAATENTNAGFKGSGYVNFQTAGSTLTFSGVSGNGGGVKTLTIRYALGNGARTGVIIVNGVSQPLSFPTTGSWTTWAEDVKVNATLNNNNSNTIQFASTGNDLANIDQFTVLPAIDAMPRTYQAENATLAGGAASETVNTGFNGSGYVNSGLNGATITFSGVEGNGGGAKSLSIRYALGATAPRTGKLTVNGVVTSITFPVTGSWTTWQTLTANITLNAGAANTIQFASTGADLGNIDEITVP